MLQFICFGISVMMLANMSTSEKNHIINNNNGQQCDGVVVDNDTIGDHRFTNPGFDYESIGKNQYSTVRKEDPRIASYIQNAILDDDFNTGSTTTNTSTTTGDFATTYILNVGAGSGSYEPPSSLSIHNTKEEEEQEEIQLQHEHRHHGRHSHHNFHVVAVEPSESMRQQRLRLGKSPAINASANKLPFDSNSFDTVMAIMTIHHWSNLQTSLKELLRVSKKNIIILTCDPDALHNLDWFTTYFPDNVEIERKRFPPINEICSILRSGSTSDEGSSSDTDDENSNPTIKKNKGNIEVINVPVPVNCTDGFVEAYYGRPEAFLDKNVRAAQSSWGFIGKDRVNQLVSKLKDDIESGKWDKIYGHYRTMETFQGAIRIIRYSHDTPSSSS